MATGLPRVVVASLMLAVPDDGFWSGDGGAKLAIILALLSAAYVAYDRIWAKGRRDQELNGVGERVTEVKALADRLDQRTNDQAQALRDLSGQVGNMREEFGETRRAIKELTDWMRESNQQTHNMLASLRVDIARTEERLAVMADIKDVVREIFANANHSRRD